MFNYRTSLTSPLRIDALDLGPGRGQIGMTICPGKRGDSEYGAQWKRDLATDITTIRAWGASTLITLMESEEMQLHGVETIGEVAKKASLHWYQLPIIDGSIPDNRFDTAWPHVGQIILNRLRSDEKVVVHCRGGLGRTGMIVSALLIETCYTPSKALAAVRAARPGTVETTDQESFVLNYLPRLLK